MQNIPNWWPHNPPVYNPELSYDENFARGPFFDGAMIERSFPPENEWIDFLGKKLMSPIGVPAGPLLNSKWTTLAARLGFDVVTYKTIRTRKHACHPLPNVLYVDTKGELTTERFSEALLVAESQPEDMAHLAITNSFGMPSPDPQFLHEDILRAKNELASGQLLIVSVVGTPREGEDFFDDFAQAARIAVESGAEVIEANFSCPNVVSGEGSICVNPDSVFEISSKIVKVIGDFPLIIKVGYYTNREVMKKVFVAAARAGVRAICGINTIGMKVNRPDGTPALGENRPTSGICGAPIQASALDFVKRAVDINESEKLGLEIMGVGGITLPEHFKKFLDEGAKIALSATGMMWDPYLAMRYHKTM